MQNQGWIDDFYNCKSLILRWKREKNQVADHFSRLEDNAKLELGEKDEIHDTFPDEHVLEASQY